MSYIGMPPPVPDASDEEMAQLQGQMQNEVGGDGEAMQFIQQGHDATRARYPHVPPREAMETARDGWHAVKYGLMHPDHVRAVIPEVARGYHQHNVRGRIAEAPSKEALGRIRAMYPHIEGDEALMEHVRAIANAAHGYARAGFIAPAHARDLVRRATGGIDVDPEGG